MGSAFPERTGEKEPAGLKRFRSKEVDDIFARSLLVQESGHFDNIDVRFAYWRDMRVEMEGYRFDRRNTDREP